MEYASLGDLAQEIKQVGPMGEDRGRLYFRQVTSALKYMHSKGYAHRDIKADNILLRDRDVVKLADFGFAVKCDPNKLLTTFCGSLPYAAPELVTIDPYNGFKVDVWAMGVFVYYMITGKMLFSGDKYTITCQITDVRFSSVKISANMSDLCLTMIKSLLEGDPMKRPTIEEVCHFEWVRWEEENEIEKAKVLFPTFERPSVTKIELKARELLEDLGIDDNVINKNRINTRGSVAGTYRILMHYMDDQDKRKKSIFDQVHVLGNKRRKSTVDEMQVYDKQYKGKKNKKTKFCSII